MEPNTNQFSNVVSLDDKRAEKSAAKSPFGPIQSKIVSPKPATETKPTPETKPVQESKPALDTKPMPEEE